MVSSTDRGQGGAEPSRQWRITAAISSLGCGGAERTLLWLSGALAERGHVVTLLTTDPLTTDFYRVPAGVSRLRAPLDAHLSCRWYDLSSQRRRLAALRGALLGTAPDVVLTFLDTLNVSVLLALRGESVPVIVSERTDPRAHEIGMRWSWLRRLCYPRAARVVVLTQSVAEWAGRIWPPWRVQVIPNPVVPPVRSLGHEGKPQAKKTVIAIGRLHRAKGYDLLLQAFAHIAADVPEWELVIVGDGAERADLARLAESLGVATRVRFAGLVTEPLAVRGADTLFVLSSRYEGFPNALAEAMAIGLPVISFDCPSGPREIIRHNIDGLLVPAEDVTALAAAMRRLLNDGAERARLAARAPEVLQRFSPDVIIQSWERLIGEVMQEAVA
jgi:GalNAc-alpha-(1->4)-GalNAc-alpha-(1->3)-diNAcBac-PP-undecaprenol alpha-1,4-N-acetyl-D-galactosaminyltransferase